MPHLPQPIISTAWRYKNEPAKIHYRAYWPDGQPRRLVTREGEALYGVLDAHLQALSYTGPASGQEALEVQGDDEDDV